MVGRSLGGMAALLVALAVALPARSAAQAPARVKVTITSAGDGMQYFPVYLARGAGFFAEEGLDADWVNVSTGTRQAASVMGGSAEMTPLAFIHVIKSAMEGANLVAFAPVLDAWALTVVLSPEAVQKAGITPTTPIDEKVRRLAGLRIGISSPGSATDTMIRNLFRARGMDPDRMVKLLPFGGGSALLVAFEKKLSDGFVGAAPTQELAVTRGTGKIVIDPFTGEIPEMNGVPFVVMATSRQTLTRRPEVILAATRALTRAMVYARTHPEETRKIVRRYFPELDEQVFTLAAENHRKATPRSPVITPDQVAKTVAWMSLGAAQPIQVSADSVIAVEPAQRAAAELLKR